MAAPITGQDTETFLFGGGLDLITPALAMPPGRCISAKNYEPEARGYRRIGGYERFDGRPSPSDADYVWLAFDDGSYPIAAGPLVGVSIRGATSGAIGTLLLDPTIDTGTWLGGGAAGGLAVSAPSVDFDDGEAIEVNPSPVTVGGEVVTVGGEVLYSTTYDLLATLVTASSLAATDALDTAAANAAEDAARAAIASVPGSGPVRGVWGYGGAVWAFRDNAGATAGKMFKATTAGWVEQSFGSLLKFDAGTVALTEGAAINGQTSGATATVRRVVLQSGTYAGTNAAGYLVLSGVTGTFQDNENIRVGVTVHVVADGTAEEITLPAGGHYDFCNHNFYGSANLRRMYFANGVGYAHEWDGTVLAPIRKAGLDAATDKPAHIGVLANHLFLAYAGGAVLFSGIGEPLLSTVTDGAGEIGFGADVTGLLDSASTALIIFGKGQIGYIDGTDADTFTLKIISDEAGAAAWTAQNAQTPTYLDQIGIRNAKATDTYGNWQTGTLTRQIEPVFKNKRRIGATPAASLRVRSKDQYRLFWDDGSGVILYLGRKAPEPMLFEYPDVGFCACSTDEGPDQAEQLFMGAEDGFVYELDSGTSFDGEEVVAALRLPFNSQKSPTLIKVYRKAALEVDASAQSTLFLTAEFAYADSSVPSATEQQFDVRGSGGFWDEANWDEFYWSSPFQGIASANIKGIGQNISIAILSRATREDPHTLTALTLNFSARRQIR